VVDATAAGDMNARRIAILVIVVGLVFLILGALFLTPGPYGMVSW
jgi:hypothetical protein